MDRKYPGDHHAKCTRKKQTEGSEYKSPKYSAIVPVVVNADFSTLIIGFYM